MALTDLFPSTAVVYRWTPSGVDAYGDETGSWVQVWTGGCRRDDLTGVEDTSDRETTMDRAKVYVEATADVRDDDEIAIDGGERRNIQQVQTIYGRSAAHHKIIRISQEV